MSKGKRMNDPIGKYGTRIIGPFTPQYKLSVNGYEVPHLTAIPQTGKNDGMISLCLDERFLIEASQDEVEKWMPFLANAMAVAAGYSCHGENSCVPNPFKVKIMGIENANNNA